MRFKDLEVGMTVVVIDFGDSDYDRPEHWSPEMDEWQGAVVSIASFDSEYVYIAEDEGAWSWYSDDFNPYCNLKLDNPNILYRNHKRDRAIDKMREEWKQQHADLRKKGIKGLG